MEGTDISESSRARVAVIGAGPAGLFASECLLSRGIAVSLYDAMPAPGRKFLLAGNSGGLNITNAAEPVAFAERYGANRDLFSGLLSDFSPEKTVSWLSGLGFSVTRGSGGKIFPDAPVEKILEAWLGRLGLYESFSFYPEWKFAGFGGKHSAETAKYDFAEPSSRNAAEDSPLALCFGTPAGPKEIHPPAAVFALGGASWPSTGSTGAWAESFAVRGIRIEPFLPANCGFEADWPPALAEKLCNVPLKNVTLSACGKSARGELMLTPYGVEGGVVYTLGAGIRDAILSAGSCTVFIDLLPDWTTEKIEARLVAGRGKESLSNYFRKRLGLGRAAVALLREAARGTSRDPASLIPRGAASVVDESAVLRDPARAAALVKTVPVILHRPRPIAEAISSAGGLSLDECDENLMLKKIPGVYCAGEMLSWEAPTGGFLLQGCFSTAFRAAAGCADWVSTARAATC